MAEVLHDFGLVTESRGTTYRVRACGSVMDESRWQGWLEFEPTDGGATLRSGRETTQPNRADTIYWASGLSLVYIEGALNRTLDPLVRESAEPSPEPAFDGPAPPLTVAQRSRPATEVRGGNNASVLDPFSVYRKGETVLRDQLRALSGWHLVNIILDHELSDIPAEELNVMRDEALVEVIVVNVRVAVNEGTVVPKIADVPD